MMASDPLPIRLKDGELQKLAKVRPLYDINCAVLAWAEARDAAFDSKPPTKRNRKLTLASNTKQAAKAGLTIARVEFDADGRIVGVVTGKPAETKPDANEWDGIVLQ